ncbi:hypothetical protein PQQ51_29320 [Paraburkholderia xenovorans]|uniref:hypothetical protein n=1 Tax=Paraburkholderia xenovorans TaxID=36873 RepID=UPI0038BA7678
MATGRSQGRNCPRSTASATTRSTTMARAAACMLEHLPHIEAPLNFEVVKEASPDIEAIFS